MQLINSYIFKGLLKNLKENHKNLLNGDIIPEDIEIDLPLEILKEKYFSTIS